MIDENELITRLEAANTNELIALILGASVEEEKVLRIYLGNERFRRLRNLVLRSEMAREDRRKAQPKNVVVIPGMLGCELTSFDRQQNRERIWLSPGHIVAGHLERLRLDTYGLGEASHTHKVKATGIMKRYYGELMLSLAEHHNVYAFWYDWRKDLTLAAGQLQASIDSWFPTDEPVYLVAHAAGGLVARAYIDQFPTRWKDAGDSKLFMIGTPNYGIYTTPQAITGHLHLLELIDLLDTHHDRADFSDIIKTFPGLYQLLPAPATNPQHEALYEAKTYGSDTEVPQEHLNNAKKFHEKLAKAKVDPTRMVYIGGHGQPTYVGVKPDKIAASTSTDDDTYMKETYPTGLHGDGTFPHHLGVLRAGNDNYIPAYYTETLHGDLCSHPKVLLALTELLAMDGLPPDQNAALCGLQPLTKSMIEQSRDEEEFDLEETAQKNGIERSSASRHIFEELVRRINSRGDDPSARHLMTDEERDIEERLTFGFLSGQADRSQETYRTIELGVPRIKINLVTTDIPAGVAADITDNKLNSYHMLQKNDETDGKHKPIDAVAVGHYSGSKPHGILRTLDYKVSSKLNGVDIDDSDVNTDEDESSAAAAGANDNDLLLTQYTQRGTIRGELGQTFFMNDPRDDQRVIAVAGMGEPGRFGTPELAVLARELCWSLGRMGKKHLATVLIGMGRDNLSVADAVTSWVRGIKLAITGTTKNDSKTEPAYALEEITFYIKDPQKTLIFDRVLCQEAKRLRDKKRMEIIYSPLSSEVKKEYSGKAIAYMQKRLERQLKRDEKPLTESQVAPTRITVSVEGDTYHFGAITDHASIPEREIPLDPKLVIRANNELAAESNPRRQLDLGQFMQRLLFPADLRGQLSTSAPLVMMLDSNTARIHWELLAQSDLTDNSGGDLSEEPHLRFLGTSRGFTRQLRTVYAPPPVPPPPAQRHLRVLVIADPAEDAPLRGAEQEGIAVADLFERFNIVHAHSETKNRIEVVRLFGPREATRTRVLRHLMMRSYDVLHFAGHCVYDKENPAASGWIFSNGERLSAYEFTRIDRSPAFVFSNACESGVTPARSDERSVDLAPSFAESFFARGVTNFVCTAWPVEDRAARDFALTLYAGLLGLELEEPADAPNLARKPDTNRAVKVVSAGSVSSNGHRSPQNQHLVYNVVEPLPMHHAMKNARVAIAAPPSDTRTWGAYQHYGNPYFRLFDPVGMRGPGQDEQDDASTDEVEQKKMDEAKSVDEVAIPSNGEHRNSITSTPSIKEQNEKITAKTSSDNAKKGEAHDQ